MTSDPARQQSVQKEVVKRYSRTNPPPSEEVALATIDRLNADVASIEANLDYADPGIFPNDEKYRVWRRRTTSALAYTRQELTFLEKWVQGWQQTARQSQRQVPGSRGIYDNLQLVVQNIRTRVQELAEEIGSSHTIRYITAQPPESVAAAQERMSYLTGVKQQLQGAFSEVTAAWTEHPLRRNDMPGVKAPLQKILSKVEVEMSIVKGYICTHAAQSPVTSNWKGVCAKALMRAVAEGFVLTPTEQAVLAQIQPHIESD